MKILMLGNSGSGKSCLLMQFTQQMFATKYQNTIGVDFKIKIVNLQSQKVKMIIWDTAGQDRFKNITSSYYRGADAIILVYDITDRTSFQGIQNWLNQIEKYADPTVKKILIGNKIDLDARRQVSKDQGTQFALTMDLPFYQTSARDGINVEQVFMQTGVKVLQTKQKNKIQRHVQNTLINNPKKNEKKQCC